MDDDGELDDLNQGGDRGLEVEGPPIGPGPVFHNAIVKYPAHCLIVTLFILSYSCLSLARHFLSTNCARTFQLGWLLLSRYSSSLYLPHKKEELLASVSGLQTVH